MIGTTLLDRYQINSELGRGGMGVVYRAFDRLLERDVAIKILSDSALGTQGRAKLMHEAQAAARLNHPNIISIYDAGEVDKTTFIVMELAEGQSLYDKKPDSLENVVSIAIQVCTALEHAHAHGIIHRDLKPENIIVTKDDLVKLTDFGLARSIASRVSVEGAIIGTVYYIAPEQALGQQIDERTDLYSLGVILYEILSGRLPFQADDPLAVVSQHLYAPIVPPSTYNSRLTFQLDSLIIRLLSKRPEDRPSSAAEVKQILSSVFESIDQVIPPIEYTPIGQLVRGRLIGREQEFAEAKSVWQSIVQTPNAQNVLLISGEPGVGKTPLVRELQTFVKVTGGAVLSGECYPEEVAPYTPIAQIIREAIPQIEEGQLVNALTRSTHQIAHPALSDMVLSSLITLAPDLYTRYQGITPNPPLDPVSEQQRLFESFVALFEMLSSQLPQLLIIEDVQWADSGTLALMRHLARRARSTGLKLLILMTYREVELDENHVFNEILFDLNRERLAARIKLCRFDHEQTRELLEVMFQDQVSGDFINAIYRETQGNLFFVEEVCKALIEDGLLYRENGHWHWPEDMTKVQIPQNVRLAIQSRLSKLSSETQDVLRLAALIGREFDFDTLRLSCEMDEDTLIEALENASRAQLIDEVKRTGGGTFLFTHGLTVTTLKDSISGLRRRRMHNRIATAIETLRPNEHATLAYHFREAGDEANALAHYITAGERAADVYANQDAIRYFSEALNLVEGNQDKTAFNLYAKRANVYDLVANRHAQREDIETMLAIAEKLEDDIFLCDALIAFADLLLETEHMLAHDQIKRAVSIAQNIGDPVREGQALRRLGYDARSRMDLVLSRQALEGAIERFRQADLPEEVAISLHLLSLTLGDNGENEGALSAAKEALDISRASGNRLQEATSLRRIAIVYINSFKYEQALPFAESALALHRELGDRSEECHALNVLGLTLLWLDRENESEEYLRESLRLSEEIGNYPGVLHAADNLVWNYYWRTGKLEAGLEFFDELMRKPFIEEDRFLHASIQGAKGEIMGMLGQYQSALELFQPAYELSINKSLPMKAKHLGWMARIQAEMGDFTSSNATLSAALEVAEKSDHLLTQNSLIIQAAYHALLKGDLVDLRSKVDRTLKTINFFRERDIRHELVAALSISAAAYLKLGHATEALDFSSEAIEISANWPFTMADYLFIHSQALRANKQEIKADEFLKKAHDRVMLVSENIQDENLRKSWLEKVPINRDIRLEWLKYHPPKTTEEQ